MKKRKKNKPLKLDLPFPLPNKKQARAVANAGYWRSADRRAAEVLKDPEARKFFERLGVLKPQS